MTLASCSFSKELRGMDKAPLFDLCKKPVKQARRRSSSPRPCKSHHDLARVWISLGLVSHTNCCTTQMRTAGRESGISCKSSRCPANEPQSDSYPWDPIPGNTPFRKGDQGTLEAQLSPVLNIEIEAQLARNKPLHNQFLLGPAPHPSWFCHAPVPDTPEYPC